MKSKQHLLLAARRALPVLLFTVESALAQPDQGGTPVEGRAIWAHPSSVAFNDSSVQAFVDHCKRANINLIVLLVEFSDKQVFYHSKKFPETIAKGFEDFDPLAAVTREAHKNGIRVHAWLCNFTQSPDGPVMQQHPEWAVRNPDGKIPSEAEYLGGGQEYYINWMCPARRPGYTDQWMLPMIEEIVANYDVDGIHYDYVRYPGDVAPDSYCFCDYCLEEMLKYAHFYYEATPDSVFRVTPTLPNPIANWWSDPTAKPKDWNRSDRKRKAEFFLKGSFMQGGPADLDYFFYTYRQDAINRFVREAWERASAIRPNIEFSAAVFKNPVASGRFIGQRWTDFSPWIDVMMPMVYRSHFPDVDYRTFLKQLEEYTRYEYEWAKDRSHLSIGLDVHYMFNEERLFLSDGLAVLDSITAASPGDRKRMADRVRMRYAKIRDHLASSAPKMEKKLSQNLSGLEGMPKERRAELQALIKAMNTNAPNDYYPKEKLLKAIDSVRRAGANGIVIFDAGGLTSRRLWPALEEAFRQPSIAQDKVAPAAEMSILSLKMTRWKIAWLERTVRLLLALSVLLLVSVVVLLATKRARKQREKPAV